MTDKEKLLIDIELEKLKIATFKNIIEGSRSINGVTWNRIKNYKRKDQIQCLKQLSQQNWLYGFFIIQLINMNKTNIYGDYKVCIKCSDPADVIEGTKNYCVECWYKHVNGKSFKEVDKQIKEEERFIKKK